jgi:hypothetical protein
MPNDLDPPDHGVMRQRALSRWDNEGGASPTGPSMAPTIADVRIAMPSVDDGVLERFTSGSSRSRAW